LLSATDLARGAVMAKGLGIARRLAYLAMRRRMSTGE
jgi:hypothetical protein